MKHSVPRKCARFNFVAGCEKRSCINMGALLLVGFPKPVLKVLSQTTKPWLDV